MRPLRRARIVSLYLELLLLDCFSFPHLNLTRAVLFSWRASAHTRQVWVEGSPGVIVIDGIHHHHHA